MMIHFKKGLILFWTLWWLTSLWTDVIGGLSTMGYFSAPWASSMNYAFLKKSLSMYSTPDWVPALFFIGIITWMALIVILFLRSCLRLNQQDGSWIPRAAQAFICSISLWLTFFLADQMIMNFDLEQNHMVQGGFELLCFLSLYLLPNQSTIQIEHLN